MALAGLWETWRSPAQETVRSFTIITTTPNELCAPIHDRMSVILAPEDMAGVAGGGTNRGDETQEAARALGPHDPVATR
jgi:hypothetical protein